MIDDSGKLLGKQKLELNDGEPATIARVLSTKGETWLAVFSTLGQQVHLLDQQLNRKATVPRRAASPDQDDQASGQILDAQFYTQANQTTQLLVAWEGGGVDAYDINSGNAKRVSEANYQSLAAIGPVLAGINEGRAKTCLLYTSPSPRDQRGSRMPSSA